MKNRYSKYSAKREINPAFILNQIGKAALKRLEDNQRNKQLDVIVTQLMCGFTLEAVLNHVGIKVFSSSDFDVLLWCGIERYSPKEKLDIIAKKIDYSINYQEKPFCYFNDIFKFRNEIVHGKTTVLICENVNDKQIDDDNFPLIDQIPGMKTKWEKNLSKGNAERWRESVKDITKILSEKANTYNPIITNDYVDTHGQM